jgi:phage terminase large subunit
MSKTYSKLIALNKKFNYLGSESRYFIVTGGRGSSKSFSVTTFLLLLTNESGHIVLFTRYTLVSASISIIPEFIEKIELMKMQDQFIVTKDEIINIVTGSKIIFKGIKTSSGTQTANLKSLQGVTTWVLDEAEELTDEDTFDKIDLSIRHKTKQNRVILILNPTTKEHFIYDKFFESKGIEQGSTLIKNDTTYIHTTYLDNIENLSESFLNQVQIIKERRPEKYKHTILGGWLDKAEGVIFNNWRVGEFKEVGVSVFGQDYGFSNDPTTLVKTNIDKTNKIIYVQLLYYKQALTTSQIARLNSDYAEKNLIVGDNSEPRLISELNALGNNVVATIKGADSVIYGITLLQDYDLIVSEDSVDLIKELNNYCWLEKKSKTPQDKHNHAIDALRYAVSYQLDNPTRGQYFIR